MLKHVQKKHIIGASTESSFIALFLKDVDPSLFSRFCPIFLCNSSYKILMKIMANRIKKILPKIISNNQGSFMQKCQIIDNIIMV